MAAATWNPSGPAAAEVRQMRLDLLGFDTQNGYRFNNIGVADEDKIPVGPDGWVIEIWVQLRTEYDGETGEDVGQLWIESWRWRGNGEKSRQVDSLVGCKIVKEERISRRRG